MASSASPTRRRPAQHGKLGVGGFPLDGLDPRGVEIARFDKQVRIRGQRRHIACATEYCWAMISREVAIWVASSGCADAAPSLLRKSLVKSLK